jgi:GNAT superfamily N-acetyltransferase
MQAFLDLMEISFRDSLEEDRVDMVEVRAIMGKIHRPHYKLMMRIMKVKSEFYIIEQNNRLVSGITLGFEQDEGNVGNVMTHPDFRRCGLARQLLQLSAKRAQALGMKQLTLSARAENTPAVTLYLSEGYERNYHAGKFVFNLLQSSIPESTNPDVTVKMIDRIDPDNMDRMLDDCYPSFYFESRNRERWIKDYIPSRAFRFIVKRAAGQTIHTYGVFVAGEQTPCGYIQAGQSRVEDAISMTSPILLKQDNELLLHALPQVMQYEHGLSGKSVFTLSISMHREDAIRMVEQMGFVKERESLSMVKHLT